MGVGGSYAAKSISCFLPMGWFKTLKGTESGSGTISFFAGIGSGNARSLSPWKPIPSLFMLYCMVKVRSIQWDPGAHATYQTLGKNSELLLRW